MVAAKATAVAVGLAVVAVASRPIGKVLTISGPAPGLRSPDVGKGQEVRTGVRAPAVPSIAATVETKKVPEEAGRSYPFPEDATLATSSATTGRAAVVAGTNVEEACAGQEDSLSVCRVSFEGFPLKVLRIEGVASATTTMATVASKAAATAAKTSQEVAVALVAKEGQEVEEVGLPVPHPTYLRPAPAVRPALTSVGPVAAPVQAVPLEALVGPHPKVDLLPTMA